MGVDGKSIRSFSLIAHCLKSNSKKLPDTKDDRFIYEGGCNAGSAVVQVSM